MLLFRVLSIIVALLIGYLVYYFSKKVLAGLILVIILGFLFPVFLTDSSFLLFSVLINILLYFVLILIVKKRH
ncbi:hypothetical protein OSO01_15240 [Oceanobacillus sojae]|uniref:Uncharacterized protein n=1 Tax=Oceanobacillus sojae TaxID=582851 RepID=A0A511ZH68_9BACI|nr:hypothetical protein OSO01_15240 [Oceanobacillus sojae]